MRISLFPELTNNIPISRSLSWDEFVREFDAHNFGFASKEQTPAFSPAEYPKDARRSRARVLRVHFGVLDIDKKTTEEIEKLVEILKSYEYLLYTSWSHAAQQAENGLWRIRVLVPFSRPVQAAEWKNFWVRMNAHLGSLNDPQCKDASRLYFMPAAPAGTEDEQIFEHHPGKPLDVDELLKAPVKIQELTTETVSKTEIQGLVKSLSRRKSQHFKRMSVCLQNILDGQPFAEEGERDETLFQVTGVLSEQWPNADARGLAQIFEKSIEAMTQISASCPQLDVVESKIRRHQEEEHAKQEEIEQQQADGLTTQIRQAYAGLRQHPYTEEELEKFVQEAGVSRSDFQKRWVIQKGGSYYIFFDGTYRAPLMDAELKIAALAYLAPAHTAGVNLYKMDQKGALRVKTADEIMIDYGTIASEIVVDMCAQKASFEGTTTTLYEAPCPLRKLEPKFDLEVDNWLRWFAGAQFETLSDWIAVVTRLDEPCAALYLDGFPGAGKSLLAEGLARLWTTEKATPLENAMANFNDALAKCPLVLGDETIPRDFRGRVRTQELRQFIQARIRPLNRKFLPSATLRGAVRLIITANNQELFVSSADALSENDIQAIVDRIIYIHCPANSATYLKKINAKSFVLQDRLAKHALWLTANRVVNTDGRFLVQGADSSLHRTLTTSSGLRSAVCNWLVAFLLSPSNAETSLDLLVRRHEGQLLVTSRALAQGWNIYPTNESAPTAGRVSQALAGLSAGPKVSLKDRKGRRTHYWVVDPMNLVTWAERNGYATHEVLQHALSEESPDSIKMTADMN